MEKKSKYDHTKPTVQEAIGISPDRFVALGEYIASQIGKIQKESRTDGLREFYVSKTIEFLETDTETTLSEKLFAMFKLGRFYEQNSGSDK